MYTIDKKKSKNLTTMWIVYCIDKSTNIRIEP